MYKRGFIIVFLLFGITVIAHSQEDSAYVLPELRIFQKTDKKVVQYNFEEYKLNKFFVNDSFLTANPLLYDYKVKLGDINRISIHNGTHFWHIAGFGAVLGFAAGFYLAGAYNPGGSGDFNVNGAIVGGLVFAVPVGLIGGLFGTHVPKYDEYELSKVPKNMKAVLIRNLFKRNRVSLK